MNLRNGRQMLFFICQLVIANSSLTLFSGCGSDAVPSSDVPIRIQVNNGEPDPVGLADSGWEVTFARIDQTKMGVFPTDYPGEDELVSAMIPAGGGAVRFTPMQYCHFDGYLTRLVGWYPTDGTWNQNDGTVSYSLNGATDVMVSSAAEGGLYQPFGQITFSHQLAKVYLFAYVEKPEYADAWGTLTEAALADQATTCVLTLPALTASLWGNPTVSFGEQKDPIYFQGMNNTGKMTNVTLAASEPDVESATPLGYVLVAPQSDATEPLKLIVKTEIGESQVISVPRDELKLEAETSYYLTIGFDRKGATLKTNIQTWGDGDTATNEL